MTLQNVPLVSSQCLTQDKLHELESSRKIEGALLGCCGKHYIKLLQNNFITLLGLSQECLNKIVVVLLLITLCLVNLNVANDASERTLALFSAFNTG